MAGLRIDEVGLAPNPVDAGAQMKVSVKVVASDHFACVGDFVGAFVNTPAKHQALAYVGDYVKAE